MPSMPGWFTWLRVILMLMRRIVEVFDKEREVPFDSHTPTGLPED